MIQRRREPRRFLATVLFTDIVGSTERAAELGDREWRRLVERHHTVVRRELRRFSGREMDTAGDGFFAVFETPENAVRGAVAIRSAVAELGLQVRAGVHMGECEMISGKVGGMAVNIGARIAAQAEAGQVLVSSSVRDMTLGSNLRFADAGVRSLKGVEVRWQLFDLELDRSGAGPVETPRRVVPVFARRTRRRVLVGVVAMVAILAVAIPVLVLRRPGAPVVVVAANAVGVLDAAGSRATAAVQVGQRPTGIAAGAGAVWVTNSSSNTVSRIDPKTYAVVPIPVGAGPTGIAVGAGAVWVANGGDATVSRISPETNSVVFTLHVRPGPTGVVVGGGSVWVTHALDASISRIDPATNLVRGVLPVGADPTGIAFGAGSMWVTNSGDGTVSRLDAQTGKADGAPIRVGNGPNGVAIGPDHAAWVANTLDGSLSRIDPADGSVTTSPVAAGGGAYAVAVSDQGVWVSNEYAGTLSRLDSKRRTVATTLHAAGSPLGLVLVGRRLWFANAGGGAALHRGGVLTIAAAGLSRTSFQADPPSIDPARSEDFGGLDRILSVTNDGLVGFRRSSGVQGALLVPDLATALPAPTDGGLTYVFHLRPGLRYSTGAPVRPVDIRYGLERMFRKAGIESVFYAKITGASRCSAHPKECDLGAGIVTDDRAGTITFHLTRSDPDFLYALALPASFAVPATVRETLPAGQWVPSTGPYMISRYLPQRQDAGGTVTALGRLDLVRNPKFRQWSPAAQPTGYPDRIVFDTGLTDADAARRVAGGRADSLWQEPPREAVDGLGIDHPGQVHASVTFFPFVRALFLNTTLPPFNNRDARRAVAYALDRRGLASDPAGFGFGQVTCQVLPPDFPGYQPYCPYTLGTDKTQWRAPDVAKALQLVAASGTKGARVVVTSGSAPRLQVASRRVVDLLTSIGFRASLRSVPQDSYFTHVADSRNKTQAGLVGWGADYPSAANFLDPLLSCASYHPADPDHTTNYSEFCDPDIERRIQVALHQQIADPASASNLWAAVDRAAVDAAPLIPFANDVRHDFVSKRVGNYQNSPQYGELIDQLWVQ